MEQWIIDIWNDLSSFERIFTLSFFVILLAYNINLYSDRIGKFFSYIGEMFNKIFKKKQSNKTQARSSKKSQEDIMNMVINHDLMILIRRIETEIDSIDFGDPVKNKLFKIVLKTYTDTIRENFINFAKEYNIDELPQNEFKKLLFDKLNDIIEITNKKLKFELGHEIYNLIVLEPIKGFRKWEESNSKLEWGLLRGIEWDKYLEYMYFNHKLLYFIMQTKYVTLEVLFNGYEKRFSNFNGELDELIKKYKWK